MTHLASVRKPFAGLLSLFLLVVLSFSSGSAEAKSCVGNGSPLELQVKVQNVRSASGMIVVTLYGDRPEEFLQSGRKIDRERVPAKLGSVTACLVLPKAGTYAIAVYHDEDGDRKVTKSGLGIPTEGYGFSNDALAKIGPPKFDDVKFTAGSDKKPVVITMHY